MIKRKNPGCVWRADVPWERRQPCLPDSGKDPLTKISRQGCLRSAGVSAGFIGAGVVRLSVMFLLACVVLSVAVAQRATGVITGRVISDDGRPVAHATINIVGAGGGRRLSGRMAILTDEDGNFQADGLDPAPYIVTASAPGYILTPGNRAVDLMETGEPDYTYVGEAVTITMSKGGVITGKVTSASGDPVVGVQIRAMRLRDEQGRAVTPGVGFVISGNRTTDDRGIYRLYGLAPGTYVVSAGGTGFSMRMNPYETRMPIFHPSSARDTAAEITVRGGEELSGIDIRYRAERGSAISGKVSGAPANVSGRAMSVTTIMLRQAASGAIVASTFIPPMGDQTGYAFYGVANGEYELIASRGGFEDSDALSSAPRRVTVSGRDVTGIDLALVPMASIAGTVVIEPAPAAELKCENKREFYPDEVVFHARKAEPGEKSEVSVPGFGDQPSGAPNDKGSFAIRSLRAGRYRVEASLPDENWFVKAMMIPAGAANAPATDVGRNGLTLKGGEKSSGLIVTLAAGAAGLKGRVVAAEGARLPARLRVHLIPVEKEAAENALRYAETRADGDGSFSFSHLAPGKYLLLARPVPETETSDKPARPIAWDSSEGAKLRREAEAARDSVELKQCQRATEFTLRYRGK
jgi:hypothetical protein